MGFLKMPLELPQFRFYRPRQLKKLEERIAGEDCILEISFANDRIEKALDKLRNGLPLARKDYKILCFHLEEVAAAGLLEIFIPQLSKFFNQAKYYQSHLKGLIVSYYDLFKNESIFRVLQHAIRRSNNIKEGMQPASDLLARSTDGKIFLINMYREFNKCSSMEEIDELSKLYLLGKNKNLYISIIQLIIAGKMKQVDGVEAAEYLISLMDEINDTNILKKSFESFLLLFKDVEFFDNQKIYHELIFEYILERMGDPFRGGRARWMNMSQDAQDVFTLWQTQKNIKHFFGDIAGDYERLQFWKQYSHYFLRVEYFPRLSGAILMQSKDHMFVEFAEVGAMYMFRREIQNVEMVENYSKRYNRVDSVKKLRDRTGCTERLIHTPYQWQSNFRNTLAIYGYKARGWANGN